MAHSTLPSESKLLWMTLSEFVEEVGYQNYASNRVLFPSISVESWAKAYGAQQTAEFEARFQAELSGGAEC
jgi:hypothetical protein